MVSHIPRNAHPAYLIPPAKNKMMVPRIPRCVHLPAAKPPILPERLKASMSTYQVNLHQILPHTTSYSYIHAVYPHEADTQPSFIQTVFQKACLLVTMGPSDYFTFLETPQEIYPFLPFKSGHYIPTSEGKFGELAVQSGAFRKTVWHLHLNDNFSIDKPLDKLHAMLEVFIKFIADKGINLVDKSVMVSAPFSADSALFIIYHHLYNHLKILVVKELQDQTDDEIANKVLQNKDFHVLLEDRLRLIKKLLPMVNLEIHTPEQLAKYRELVLLPLIQRMLAASKAVFRT